MRLMPTQRPKDVLELKAGTLEEASIKRCGPDRQSGGSLIGPGPPCRVLQILTRYTNTQPARQANPSEPIVA
jgi:hypothetical protein